jgi:hypothetical protein
VLYLRSMEIPAEESLELCLSAMRAAGERADLGQIMDRLMAILAQRGLRPESLEAFPPAAPPIRRQSMLTEKKPKA